MGHSDTKGHSDVGENIFCAEPEIKKGTVETVPLVTVELISLVPQFHRSDCWKSTSRKCQSIEIPYSPDFRSLSHRS
jgi:hypothetical protein